MNDNIIKIGMVGCGEISYTHAQAAKKINNISFISCCDVIEEKSISWGKKYGCNTQYSNLEDMFKSEELDAVILCTWPPLHLEQIELALKYGIKNILCEKSLTLSGEEALKIYQLVKKNNSFLLEACKYRYHPAISKIETLINSKELGKIDSISATFSNYEPDENIEDESRNWRYRKECGGGVAYDWMSYLVNAANYFSKSKPKRVFASGSFSKKFDVLTRLNGIIEYENNITASISSSKYASFSQELEITCANGIINLPISWGIFGNVNITCRHRMQDWPYIIKDTYEVEHKDSFVIQLQHFIDCIQGKTETRISLQESVINIITIEALVNSVIEGKSIELNIPSIE